MGRTVRLVLGLPTYAAVAGLSAVGGLSVFALSQNVGVLVNVVLLGNLPLSNRLTVLAELYPLVGTAYTPVQSAVMLVAAGVIGVNVAMVAYHVREHDLAAGAGSSGSLVGVVFGTLGAGCAACGSAVLAGVLSLVGAGGLLTLLPLDGLEFSLIALVVLVLSIHWIAEGLRGGEVAGCPVDVGRS